MSESDFAFDQMLERDFLLSRLQDTCEQQPKQCNWFRNNEGFLQCRSCGREVDE